MSPAADRIIQAGRRAFPSVGISDREIESAWVAKGIEAEVSEKAAAEIFLALACGLGDARALGAFETLYVPDLRALLEKRTSNRDHVDEAMQRLRATIFTARGDRPPEILDYSGAGPLIGWLRIAALRILIRHEKKERRGRPRASEELDAILEKAVPHVADPERLLERSEGREALGRALRASWQGLDAEDRLRLRVRYAEGHGIDHVAQIEGVHRATAARRLLRAEERLIAGARAVLKSELRLGDVELDSVLRVLHSQLDVSLTPLFRPTDGAPRL